MKQRCRRGRLPLFGPAVTRRFRPRRPRPRRHPSLAAAATYLGLTEAELRTQLGRARRSRRSRKDKGKSVDGLKKVLAAEAKKKLEAAVKAGHLTQAQADDLEARMTEHLDDVVNGRSRRSGRGRHVHGFGLGSPSAGETQPPVRSDRAGRVTGVEVRPGLERASGSSTPRDPARRRTASCEDR